MRRGRLWVTVSGNRKFRFVRITDEEVNGRYHTQAYMRREVKYLVIVTNGPVSYAIGIVRGRYRPNDFSGTRDWSEKPLNFGWFSAKNKRTRLEAAEKLLERHQERVRRQLGLSQKARKQSE